MARLTWHAYYFDSLDRASPAVRTEIIEAANEDDAGKIAIAQMGRCMRVDVTLPVWGAPSPADPKPEKPLRTPAWEIDASLALQAGCGDERQRN
jgi:hypothetical protein